MTTLRRILLVISFSVLVLAVLVFASANRGTMSLDVGVARLEHVPIGVAFAAAFGCGWALGLVIAGCGMLKGAGERRRLKRKLRNAEAEARNLRNLTQSHAD